MEFKVIEFDNKEEWERITQNKEIYYQWQYIDAFFKNGDGIPKLAYARENNEYVYNVFFLRDIAQELNLDKKIYNYYDIITPYGYGGIDKNNSNKKLLDFYLSNFKEFCKNNNIVSEFIRLNPILNNYKNYNSEYQIINLSKTVYVKLENPEQIWSDMESRCRNTIRKAQKNGLIVKSGFDKKMLDEFVYIYRETMSRDKASDYYFFSDIFFDSIYNNLGQFAKIYTVYKDDKPISSSIIIYNGKSAHYHLSGTLSEYMRYGANNLGLYEVAVDLCNHGYKTFHLGGGYGGDTSPLLKFKKSFNKFGDLDFYIGKMIYNTEIYEKLCEEKKVSKDVEFFPQYRADI